MKLWEEMLERQVIYEGRVVTLHRDTVRLENGATALREVVEHPGGVCVLALEADGSAYTVRQFRYPYGRVVEELPAGKLEPGEDPRVGVERELSEEVGVEAGEWIDLGELLMSPGFCNETLHLYLARDLRRGKSHPDEDEFLTVERTPFSTLVERVMAGELTDAKTVIGILKGNEYLSCEAGGTR